jgi:hypothetical protein
MIARTRTTLATLAATFAVAVAAAPSAHAAVAVHVPVGGAQTTTTGTAEAPTSPTTTGPTLPGGQVMESKNDGRYKQSSEAFKKRIQSVCATYAEAILYYQALYHHEKEHDPNSQATADALKRWDAALNEYERLCIA